jgi:hypothetical protein
VRLSIQDQGSSLDSVSTATRCEPICLFQSSLLSPQHLRCSQDPPNSLFLTFMSTSTCNFASLELTRPDTAHGVASIRLNSRSTTVRWLTFTRRSQTPRPALCAARHRTLPLCLTSHPSTQSPRPAISQTAAVTAFGSGPSATFPTRRSASFPTTRTAFSSGNS